LTTRLRRESGYSLIEMLTAMTIMAIVFAGLTQIFTSASKADIDMQNRFQAQQEGRLALDKLRRDIHCASAVSLPGGQTWPSAQSTVTLTIPLCSGGNVTWCTAQRSGSATRWDLYRQAGATCSSSSPSVRVASYLTTSTPFTAYTQASGFLNALSVSLPVGVNKVQTTGIYKLQDTVYLRNSTRNP
jgi:prepilin-type N-terminal cleavage/methylation domain-containing protein